MVPVKGDDAAYQSATIFKLHQPVGYSLIVNPCLRSETWGTQINGVSELGHPPFYRGLKPAAPSQMHAARFFRSCEPMSQKRDMGHPAR
jgi:hypothetical protein